MIQKGDKFFGTRIKELREKKGYTQEQLAEKIDIDIRSLSRIETGMSFTTFEKIKKLAESLDVNVEELFKSGHIDSKENLIKKINHILKDCADEDVKTVYRLIVSILR